ncbi:MAG TPA: TonB family protein [Verrucomicrobiae bacterium]|nr:TonB family protein [Verrucomicrobiae bacterium]
MQKKCFIVSIGFHLSLAVILIVGPAFLSSSDDSRVVKPIDFVPVKIVEGELAGGGNPNANPPPPAPPAPAPPAAITPLALPTPTPPVKIEPPKEEPKPEVARVERPVPVPKPKPAKSTPQVSTTLVTSKPETKTASKTTSNSKEAEKRKAAEQVGRAIAGLRNNLAPTTSIDLRGPGGGGETYAGVEQAILSIYDRAWISPVGMDASEAEVKVSVTIESDGTVSSSRITQPSGDARVDRSVQQALDRVTSIPGWDGKRRTVEFSFKSRAKEII